MASPVGGFILRLLILLSALSRLVVPELCSRRTTILGWLDRLSWCLLVMGHCIWWIVPWRDFLAVLWRSEEPIPLTMAVFESRFKLA